MLRKINKQLSLYIDLWFILEADALQLPCEPEAANDVGGFWINTAFPCVPVDKRHRNLRDLTTVFSRVFLPR